MQKLVLQCAESRKVIGAKHLSRRRVVACAWSSHQHQLTPQFPRLVLFLLPSSITYSILWNLLRRLQSCRGDMIHG